MTEALLNVAPINGEEYTKKSKKRRRDDGPEKPVGNGNDGRSRPSKEERKEAKRLRKLAKEPGAGQRTEEPLSKSSTARAVESSAANGEESEPERKAERSRLKRERKTVRTENGDAVIATNGTSDLNSGYKEDPSLAALPQYEVDDFLSANFITTSDPTSSTNLRPIIQFSHLPSSTTSSSAVFTTFQTPTPIQSAAWPFLLSGRDVIGVAETGSGKTLAFGVPCIRSIAKSSRTKGSPARAVIVSPTRELAVQIHTQMETLASPAQLSTVCVYGGVPKDPQRLALKTAHIIVATPGRLNDLINEGSADLSNVSYVVLDEADRMLDKGFEEEIRKILGTTPTKGRQTLMFTATWPPSVRDLASTFMRHPVHISIGADNPTGELRANTSITQLVEVIDPRQKETRLLQLLRQHQGTTGPHQHDRILVFCLYKKEAARIETFLRTRGLHVTAIHGDLSQEKRSASLAAFKSGSCPLLIATDVAARGLDIPAVKAVINVTFPLTVEDYVHRIGRTGRAGAQGLAVTLFTEQDKGLSGGLINVLRAAGQEVPEELWRFGATVKKKGHEAYGAFYKDPGVGGKKEGTKIRFD
ncbi:P-loop containing nucleoside triphosphate hydrolase protein [Usnea florida]